MAEKKATEVIEDSKQSEPALKSKVYRLGYFCIYIGVILNSIILILNSMNFYLLFFNRPVKITVFSYISVPLMLVGTLLCFFICKKHKSAYTGRYIVCMVVVGIMLCTIIGVKVYTGRDITYAYEKYTTDDGTEFDILRRTYKYYDNIGVCELYGGVLLKQKKVVSSDSGAYDISQDDNGKYLLTGYYDTNKTRIQGTHRIED